MTIRALFALLPALVALLPAPARAQYRVAGQAWIDENRDAMHDADERSLGGVHVRLSRTGSTLDAFTDAEGRFGFRLATAGDFVVEVVEWPPGVAPLSAQRIEGFVSDAAPDTTFRFAFLTLDTREVVEEEGVPGIPAPPPPDASAAEPPDQTAVEPPPFLEPPPNDSLASETFEPVAETGLPLWVYGAALVLLTLIAFGLAALLRRRRPDATPGGDLERG